MRMRSGARATLRRPSPQLLVGAGAMLCALLALTASWPPLLGVPSVGSLLVAAGLIAATIVAYQFPIHLLPRTKVYMSSVPFYLLAVLVAPPLAAAAAGVATLLGELSVRKRRGNGAGIIAAEVGRRTLVVLLASLIVLPVTDLLHMHTHTVALVAAAVVLGGGDVATFPLVMVGRGSDGPWRLMTLAAREAALMEGAQYLLGLLGALAAAQQLWAVVLLAAPTALVYLAFRVTALAEQAQARAEQAQARAEQAQARAEQAQRVAEQAMRVRDTFLITASHDLRTPLTNIIGRGDMIQTRLDRIEPGGDNWVGTQMRSLLLSAQRMSTTIEELTDVAHVQMGQPLTLKVGWVDVGDMLHAMVDMYGWQAAPPVVIVGPDGVVVQGDRARLERALRNIVENARAYSDEGAPVQIALGRQGQWAVVTVRDHGVGIPTSDLPHIFTPFYRASTARQAYASAGGGLAGANAIVEQHGGSITVASGVGEGTTMTIYLPRAATLESGPHSPTTHGDGDARVAASAFACAMLGEASTARDTPTRSDMPIKGNVPTKPDTAS